MLWRCWTNTTVTHCWAQVEYSEIVWFKFNCFIFIQFIVMSSFYRYMSRYMFYILFCAFIADRTIVMSWFKESDLKDQQFFQNLSHNLSYFFKYFFAVLWRLYQEAFTFLRFWCIFVHLLHRWTCQVTRVWQPHMWQPCVAVQTWQGCVYVRGLHCHLVKFSPLHRAAHSNHEKVKC